MPQPEPYDFATHAEAKRIYRKVKSEACDEVRLGVCTALEELLATPYYRKRVDSAVIGHVILNRCEDFVDVCKPMAAQVFGLLLCDRMAMEEVDPIDKWGRGPYPHKVYTRRERPKLDPEEVSD